MNKCNNIPGLSYHDAIFLDSNDVPSRQKPVRHLIHQWKQADRSSIKKYLAEFSIELTASHNINSSLGQFLTILKSKYQSSVQKHIQIKMTSQRNSQSWCNSKEAVLAETSSISESQAVTQAQRLAAILQKHTY